MAQEVRVTCINKTDRQNPHERIHAVGGINPDGSRWRLPLEAAIAGIERGDWLFFVERPAGNKVYVVIALSPERNKYLKTQADAEQPNNLLALPECP